MIRSFQNLVAGTLLATTTFCGVTSPMEAKATPSPGEDWVYVNSTVEPCIPRFYISDNVVDNTIRIQVAEGNTCPVSGNLFIFIQDDRPQPLRLKGVYRHNSWVANIGDARPGIYRVMGISPTPSGIGDYNYIQSRDLGIDQVLTIAGVKATTQTHTVIAPLPRVETAPPQQVVTTLDPESKYLLRNFARWMPWIKDTIDWLKANWSQLEPLIRDIEAIKPS
jgi:hypothetical protein